MEVVNNPTPNSNDGGSGLGFFLGAILLIIFAFLLFYYGIPAIKNNMAPAVTVPQTQNQPAPQNDTEVNIPIPDDVDINITDDREQ